MSVERMVRMTRLFEKAYGYSPELLWARAPGRVDLMGSHTDYNLGYVLTLPISREAWMAVHKRDDRQVRIHSANLDDGDCFWLDDVRKAEPGNWRNYVRGVAAVLQREGLPLCGFDAVLHSTVPIASGLSSSAAIECVTAAVFGALSGWPWEAARMAQLCQRAEHEFAGVQCGILDQFSSCLGLERNALLLDCRDLSTRPVPIAAGLRVVICDTKAKRMLAGGEYAERRSQCEEGARQLGVAALRDATAGQVSALQGDVGKRSRFIVEESARVLRLEQALRAGARAEIGRLCAESFTGARDLFGIVTQPMIAMRESMLAAPGVIGARQAGAGFGGCLVALVDEAETEAFAAAVETSYETATGIQPEVYPVEPAAGAGIFEMSRWIQ